MPYKTTRTLLHFLITIGLMLAVVLIEPSLQANERIRMLGKDSLGETVKQFRIRYPKAVCGTATSAEINPQNLVNLENDTGQIHCCLNDRDSLNEISTFRILNLDDCAVHAAFWKNALYGLSYMVDARSVQIVLHDFEKLYGSPTRSVKDPEDATRLSFVDWMEGMTSLELKLCRLGGTVFPKDSQRSQPGEPWLEVVSISLWNSELGS